MTGKKRTPRPTEGELEILKVLWLTGPATVRQVNEKLCENRPVGYTTTLKLMQIMHEKGLLSRDDSQRSHVYSPLFREKETQGFLLDRIVQSLFRGSAANLVLQVLGSHRASSEEISQIRELLDRMEHKKREDQDGLA